MMTTTHTVTMMAIMAPVLKLMEPSFEEPAAPAAFVPAVLVGSEPTLPGWTPKSPPPGLEEAMAEKTLEYVLVAAEDGWEEEKVVVDCAREVWGWMRRTERRIARSRRLRREDDMVNMELRG
jgi:hypothetical protein